MERSRSGHACLGLATPSGFLSSTGVGGLTLGGGIGCLSGTLGLTLDNLPGVDMVLADGSVVTASEDEHADLFWAVRGGGGNFGVVTSFVFKLHEISTVYGGPMFWPIEQAAEILPFWRDFILNAREDINGWLGLVTVPPGR
jgi:FAD/FMN-containing dehydrogenase